MHRLCHLGRVVARSGCNCRLKRPPQRMGKPRFHITRTPATTLLTWEVGRPPNRAQGRSGADMAVPPIGLIGGTAGVSRWPKLDLFSCFCRPLWSDLERPRLVRRALGLVRGDVGLVLEGDG